MLETWCSRCVLASLLRWEGGAYYLSEPHLTLPTLALAKEVGVLYRQGGRGGTTFWLPCASRCNVDISFSYFPKSLIRTLFRLRERIEIAPGLYCYGRGATSAAKIIRSDEQLVLALERVVRWADRVYWTATEISAVDSTGSIACDGSGGRRFFENLKSAASGLSQIDSSVVHSKPGVDTFLPSRLGAILLALIFAGGVPACIYLICNAIAK